MKVYDVLDQHEIILLLSCKHCDGEPERENSFLSLDVTTGETFSYKFYFQETNEVVHTK